MHGTLHKQISKLYKEHDKSGERYSIAEIKKIQRFIILSVSCMTAPRRNQDWVHMLLRNDDGVNNFIDVTKKEATFRIYKTSSSYGETTFKWPTKLINVIKNYMSRVNTHSDWLIFKTDASAPDFKSNENALLESSYVTRLLNQSFTQKGQNIGVNSIRHAFANAKYNGMQGLPYEEIKRTADAMGHSVETSMLYIKNRAKNNDSSDVEDEAIEMP